MIPTTTYQDLKCALDQGLARATEIYDSDTFRLTAKEQDELYQLNYRLDDYCIDIATRHYADTSEDESEGDAGITKGNLDENVPSDVQPTG